MPDQANGYQRPYNWTNDALQGIDIDQGRMDDDGNQVAAALNNRLRLDGKGPPPSADIPMNGNSFTNLRDGVAPTDPVTVRQSQATAAASAFAYCSGILF